MEIVRAKREEYQKIQRFLEDAYGHFHNFFPLSYPQGWKEENTQFENIYLIKEKGEILSLVRIFPLSLVQNGIEIKVGGIGAVSTSFYHRGKGYMSILMEKAIKDMEEQGYQISVLWGDRHRYKNFGYEVGGKEIELIISRRGLDKCNVGSVKAKRYLGQDEVLLKIIESYNSHLFRKKREREEFYMIYKKIGVLTYYAEEGKSFAYVSFRSGKEGVSVEEFGGEPELILRILRFLSERFATQQFILIFPDYSLIPQPFIKAMSFWREKPNCMVKIIDLKATLERYARTIENEFPEGEITLQIKGKKPVTLKKEGDRLLIEEREGENLILLDEIDMAKLLFSSPEWFNLPDKIKRIVKIVFPLKLFIWPFDHI
ncbi:MAG: hypothetical protein DRP67_02575 [Candidatus Omnitrophota bacterium]|nr:MAG: hypothetical protein DRP67_02575 [Candidatus Omnitrophota bacterium]